MIRALLIFLAALCLTACAGRPLAEGERALAEDLFGPSLDVQKVRVKSGFRGAPKTDTAPPLPENPEPIKIRPGICDRTAPTPPEGPPPGWALYNNVHFSKDYYRNDTAPGWPNQILLPQTFIMAHELVHVWQWQNRKRTGYRPAKAALEAILNQDPYFYVPEEGAGLLEYGFEQQASLLEDYLCYAIFDPKNARRGQIRAILAPHFQMDRLDEALAR
ncbi:hypothetical protein AIOL_004056 [Candidatus Rhodobacter oscarellae]|uniref:DUF4157 domain-containing protein n=1 Tax=Candidatus Rhodobacter oscarellae TaxID=1675527 RepID=A0A0J9E8I6_9RHOB|nr:hypothetical protein [Candidatus Rhodobacter lobularis]KMW59075.1 hypothetical protein AIOL_004056 [Candidatus Rhodobacter lobularis]